ncbi:hypothetical protein [Streptomyces sp. NPDC056061]|uniref:hypothetical protein n=1 Tax=Streptomyces sp. NPDC056061 TaxID=3345700 RepID=UPI0035E17C8B
MSDLYELQLALDLRDSLSPAELGYLRGHLGESMDATEEAVMAEGDTYPLLSSRGPAWRIGGVLVGSLCRGSRGWSLTIRQEVHPDQFDDLQHLLTLLGTWTTSVGTIGYLRFYETEAPDVLIADSGRVRRRSLTGPDSDEEDLLPV